MSQKNVGKIQLMTKTESNKNAWKNERDNVAIELKKLRNFSGEKIEKIHATVNQYGDGEFSQITFHFVGGKKLVVYGDYGQTLAIDAQSN